MIKQISIQNFKSLRKIHLELRPLNLLMGLNGMGKSSLLQAILLLRQSRDLTRGMLNLNDYMVQIGEGQDAMYQFSKDDFIRFYLADIQDKTLTWTFKYEAEAQYLETEDIYDNNDLSSWSIFNSNFQYLRADRSSPLDDYRMSSLEVVKDRQVGINGEYAIHYLNEYGNEPVLELLRHPKAKSESLMHNVDAWMSEISPGIKLDTNKPPGSVKILLNFQFETGTNFTNRFRPKNVGFGISHILPIIVTLLSFQPEKLIVIENPESHVHPRGQAEMGRLIALASNAGAQLLVETHSDHILNGIRVAVKQGLLSPNDANLFYFEKRTTADEQFTRATTINIDTNGTLSNYPENLLDEWSNQLSKLI